MSYKIFEKDGITYKLFLGKHNEDSYPIIENTGGLEDLDVLILEQAGLDANFIRNVQYGPIFSKVAKLDNEFPIYDVDVATTPFGKVMMTLTMEGGTITGATLMLSSLYQKPSRRAFLKRFGKAFTGVALVSPFLSMIDTEGVKKTTILSEPNSKINDIFPTPVLGFRNAYVARMVEEAIVPKHKKPNLKVGLLYGELHTGIEDCIQSTTLRDLIINAYQIHDYPGIQSETINEVRRFHLNKENVMFPNNPEIKSKKLKEWHHLNGKGGTTWIQTTRGVNLF